LSQDNWNFIFIGLSFALYVGIAIRSRAGSTKEYYVAGGGVSPFANGMATAADWMSAATFISMAGGIAAAGYDGSRFLMGWTGGFVLLTTLMVPYLRKFGKATVPDFVGDRFYSNAARTVAVICAIFICMTYIMGQMRGVGVVFSQLFGISITSGVLIGGAIVFFYAGLGGMKGITYTQVAQYCVMVFAYTIPAIYISMILTGNAFPQFGLIGDLKPTKEEQAVAFLQRLNEVNQSIGFAEYTSGKMSTMNLFFITAALMFGTAGLPHVIVRFFTVKSVKAVRISACWTLFFIAIVYLTAPTIGGFSRYNLIKKINGIEYQVAPKWFKQFEDTGQIVWVDKNKDGKIFYSGPLKDSDPKNKNNVVFLKAEGQFKAKPVYIDQKGPVGQRLISNQIDSTNPNELHYGNDIMVMANPYMAGEKGLPQPVIALLMAGCIAAALSTAAGLLLVLSTSVSHDLMKKNHKARHFGQTGNALRPIRLFGSAFDRGLLRHQPTIELCGKNRGFCLRTSRIFLLPYPHHGDFLQKNEQTGRHSWNDYRNRFYLKLYRLFSIYNGQQGLLVRHIAGGNRIHRNDPQLCHRFRRKPSDSRPAPRGAGYGGEHSHPQRRRPSVGPLIS
jgi:cation/acetate symporter